MPSACNICPFYFFFFKEKNHFLDEMMEMDNFSLVQYMSASLKVGAHHPLLLLLEIISSFLFIYFIYFFVCVYNC